MKASRYIDVRETVLIDLEIRLIGWADAAPPTHHPMPWTWALQGD